MFRILVKPFTVKEIALSGMIAAVYATLTVAFAPISFLAYQIRVAEALTVLPYLTRAAVPGLFVGCALANVMGGLGWQDIILGSLITLIAAIFTRNVSRITRSRAGYLIAVLPVLMLWTGSIMVLNNTLPDLYPVLLCLASLLLAVIGGRFRGMSIKRNRLESSGMISTIILLISTILLGVAYFMMLEGHDWLSHLIGGTALLAGWLLTVILSQVWATGEDPNIFIAPLPPVLFNAFGVSIYLAPMIDIDYWFSVQMIGIGQLIACYLLGLPLLRILLKRRNLFPL